MSRSSYTASQDKLRNHIEGTKTTTGLEVARKCVSSMVSNMPPPNKLGMQSAGFSAPAVLLDFKIGTTGEKGTPVSISVILHQKAHKIPRSIGTASENGNQVIIPVTYQRTRPDGKKDSAITIGEIPIGGNVTQINIWVPRSGKGSDLKKTLEENGGPGKLMYLEKLTAEAYVPKGDDFSHNDNPMNLPISFKAKGFTFVKDEEQYFFNEPLGFYTLLLVLASNRCIIPEPCYLNAPRMDQIGGDEENLTEDEKKKRKEASKKNQKDKIAKLLKQIFLGSIYSGSMVMKISNDPSLEIENLCKYFGDSVKVERARVPHAPTELNEEDGKPVATSDFYSVNIAQDGSVTVTQMYHSAGAISVSFKIGDEQFSRCFCTKFTCFSEFKNREEIFLPAIIGSSSPVGWMVAEKHADELTELAVTFPSSMDTSNVPYDPQSEGEQVTYTVCGTSNRIVTNFGQYVVTRGIPISLDEAIRRLRIRWPDGKNPKFNPFVPGMENGKIVSYSLKIDPDTLKSQYPSGAPSHVTASYMKNTIFNPKFSPFPGSCTSNDRSSPNPGVWLVSETPVIRLPLSEMKDLLFYSLSTASFPREFIDYLHSMPYEDAIKITDQLFSAKFDSSKLSPEAFKAFEIAGKEEGLFSLTDHHELTYTCTLEDAEKIRSPLENLAEHLQGLVDGPFSIGPGLTDQFKNPVRDIYLRINGGDMPSQAQIDEYYSNIIATYTEEGNLSCVVPTDNLYRRIISDTEQLQSSQGVTDHDMIPEKDIPLVPSVDDDIPVEESHDNNEPVADEPTQPTESEKQSEGADSLDIMEECGDYEDPLFMELDEEPIVPVSTKVVQKQPVVPVPVEVPQETPRKKRSKNPFKSGGNPLSAKRPKLNP